PDLEHDSRIQSPSNSSEISRSQSQGEYYPRSGGQPIYNQSSIQNQPLRDDRYYREDPRSQSIPPPNRYISPHQNILPSVRINVPAQQQSQYFQNSPSPYDSRMPPPSISEQPYGRDTYTRSPIQ